MQRMLNTQFENAHWILIRMSMLCNSRILINRKLINHSELILKSSFGNYCQQYFCCNSSSGINPLYYQSIVGSRDCCTKFVTGLNIIISPVANFAQHPLASNNKLYMHYFNPRFVYFKPTFWRSKTFFSSFFSENYAFYLWIAFKSDL